MATNNKRCTHQCVFYSYREVARERARESERERERARELCLACLSTNAKIGHEWTAPSIEVEAEDAGVDLSGHMVESFVFELYCARNHLDDDH